MSAIANIAYSGMQAAQAQLGVAANNTANANTEGYRRETATTQAQVGGGVSTQVQRLPEPGANLAQDMVNQLGATYAFQANLGVYQRANAAMGRLLSVYA